MNGRRLTQHAVYATIAAIADAESRNDLYAHVAAIESDLAGANEALSTAVEACNEFRADAEEWQARSLEWNRSYVAERNRSHALEAERDAARRDLAMLTDELNRLSNEHDVDVLTFERDAALRQLEPWLAREQELEAEWHGRERAAEGDVPWQVVVDRLNRVVQERDAARGQAARAESEREEAMALVRELRASCGFLFGETERVRTFQQDKELFRRRLSFEDQPVPGDFPPGQPFGDGG